MFQISAAEGTNVEPLMDSVIDSCHPDPAISPRNSNWPPGSLVLAEYVREKALNVLREEVPHAVAVEIEDVEIKQNVTVVYAVIHVERATQRM